LDGCRRVPRTRAGRRTASPVAGAPGCARSAPPRARPAGAAGRPGLGRARCRRRRRWPCALRRSAARSRRSGLLRLAVLSTEASWRASKSPARPGVAVRPSSKTPGRPSTRASRMRRQFSAAAWCASSTTTVVKQARSRSARLRVGTLATTTWQPATGSRSAWMRPTRASCQTSRSFSSAWSSSSVRWASTSARPPGHVAKDHRLAASRRQHDELAGDALPQLPLDPLHRGALVIAHGQHGLATSCQAVVATPNVSRRPQHPGGQSTRAWCEARRMATRTRSWRRGAC